jgi:hypothetical protein
MKNKMLVSIRKIKNTLIQYLSENIISVRILAFTIITFTAIIARLNISYSNELFLGVNGGYYPLQVRHILDTGLLGFNDVPLYFYFCALILKIGSFLGFALTNENIISVIKTIDCIALPLLSIPLFKLVFRKEHNIPFFASIAILLFAIFSFSPFAMLGDVQKNAFAIPLLFFFIYLIDSYFINHKKRTLVLALVTLFVISLTHFGVFTFALIFLTVLLFIVYHKEAIIPSILIFLGGFAIILLFDAHRAYRLIGFWNEIFGMRFIFEEPMFLPVLFNTMFSYFLVIIAVIQYRKFKNETEKVILNIVITLIVLIIIFGFPFYEANYVIRFNALLFVPQSLLILYLIRMNRKLAIYFSILLVFMTVLFSSIYIIDDKKPCIDELSFQDLQNIKKYIPENKDSTIIIARHGLEFWTSWALHVKVCNDRAMEKLNLDNYNNVLFLQPKKGFGKRPHKKRPMNKRSFHEMPIPENSLLIYSSDYFNVYKNQK